MRASLLDRDRVVCYPHFTSKGSLLVDASRPRRACKKGRSRAKLPLSPWGMWCVDAALDLPPRVRACVTPKRTATDRLRPSDRHIVRRPLFQTSPPFIVNLGRRDVPVAE